MSGRVFNVFRTLARHPDLLRRWLVFGAHVLSKSTLPARDRELLILRTAWRSESEYEWGQHVLIGRREGLTDEEIRRVAADPDGAEAESWSDDDRQLLRACDQLLDDVEIGDATWRALSERFDERQLMDLVFCVGQYRMLAGALRTFRVPLDEGIPGFEETAGRRP